jgi:ABC-type bacteriocin/lantibiotic exporter with double-glycine peptidase domain
MLINNFKRTFQQLNASERRKYLIISIFTLFSNVLEIVSIGSIPIYISFIFDPNLINKYLLTLNIDLYINVDNFENFAIFISIIVVLIFFVKNIFIAYLYYLNSKFIQNINIRIGNQIYSNNIFSPYLKYINKSPAELIRNHGVIRSFSGILGHYQRLFLEITLLILILFASLNIFFEITLLFLGIFVLFFLIFYNLFKNYLKRSGQKIQIYKKVELSLLENSFSAIKEIKIYLMENYFKKLFKNNYFKLNRIILINQLLQKLPKIFLELIAVVSIILITLHFLSSSLNDAEKISTISLFVIIAARLIPAFNGISVAMAQIKHNEPTIDIIQNELLNNNEINLDENKKIKAKNINNIKLCNLNFSFDRIKNLYFENINLDIIKGDHIGIHGVSGSGKTTLINLILGLIKPDIGEIYYNDTQSKNVIMHYYKFISYVPQDTILFNDTIKNNLTFNAEKIDYIKLNKVIKICKLDSFVDNLPLKIETNVGEKGLKISGGQKQRIGIARALYRNFDLLILDEATSSLNKDYENEILKEIFNLYNDKIIITISHDLDALKYCNKKINIRNNDKTQTSQI